MMAWTNRYGIIFAVAMASVLAFGSFESKSIGIPDATDEYAVYAAAMQKVVGGGSYIVLDATTIHSKPKELDSALSFPIEDADRISDDLVSDFKAKNQQTHTIAQHFPVDVHVTLITEHERDTMFAGCIGSLKCGWKTFYDKYPGARGIVNLSRAGFNQKRDTALVYIGNVRDWEVGQGMYLLLVRTNGGWKVISRSRGWTA